MRSTVLLLALAACSSDTSTGVAAALLWVENLHGTDASSLRMVVGPNEKVTVAAYNEGVVNLSGQLGDEIGEADRTSLIVARFNDLDRGGLQYVWAKAFTVDFDTPPRIALAVTSNGDVAVGVGELDAPIQFDGTTPLGGPVGASPSGAVAMFAGPDGAHIWSGALEIDEYAAAPSDFVIDPAEDSLVVAGTGRRVFDSGGSPLASPGAPQLYLAALDLDDGAPLYGRAFGDGPDTRGTRLVRAANGDLYVAGRFQGSLTFNNDDLSAASVNDASTFVGRAVAANGNPIWAVNDDLPAGGPVEIASDQEGNLLVAGDFIVDGAARAGTQPLATVAKLLGDNGALIWGWRLGDGSAETKVQATSIAVDSANAAVVAGTFLGRHVVANTFLTATSADALLVVKLDANGVPLWGRFSGGTGEVSAADVRVGAGDNVYACGVFEAAPAPGTTPDPDPSHEVFMLKLAP
jgi:hypothetical protein